MQHPSPSTPSPLQQTERYLANGAIEEYEIFEDYVVTHGNHLIDNPKYKLFDLAYRNHGLLVTLLHDPILSKPEGYGLRKRLEQFQQNQLDRTHKAYRKLMTPTIAKTMKRKLQPPLPKQPTSSNQIRHPTPNSVVLLRPGHPKNCYICHNPFHQKRQCPSYRCYYCRKTQPGHTSNECPQINSQPDYQDGHDYNPDGNLNGEQ